MSTELAPKTFLLPLAPAHGEYLALHKIFKFSEKSTGMTLDKMSQVRKEMMDYLRNGTSWKAAQEAVNTYLPYVYGMVTAIEASTELRTNAKLYWSWMSSFRSEYGGASSFELQTHVYEWAMTLCALAAAHINLANQEMAAVVTMADYEQGSKVAAHQLRTAAGVYEYVREVVLGKWPAEEKHTRPAECYPEMCDCMIYLCMAQAEQLAVVKAANSSMKKGLVARLCCDVYRKYDSALSCLAALPKTFLMPTLQAYADVMSCYWRAVTMKFQGIHHYDESEPGLAESFLKVAMEQINLVRIPAQSANFLQPMVDGEKAEIRRFFDAFHKDNLTVYLERVLNLDELVLPEPKSLFNLIAFEPPQPCFKELV